jgi:hypothetical protein
VGEMKTNLNPNNKMKKQNYYIVRAESAGVFFGQIEEQEAETCNKEGQVKMNNLRKIHYWDGACAVEQISQTGVNANSRLTVTVATMNIAKPIQVIPCTEKAIENLLNQKEWKQ